MTGDVIAPGAPNVTEPEKKVKDLLKRFGVAVQRRTHWEPLWQDCYDYALPQRTGFYQTTPGEDRMDNVFDETAIVGTQEFASRMQSGICPPFTKFLVLEPGPNIESDQRDQVMKGLQEIEADFFDTLNHSNFNQEMYEFFLELAVSNAPFLIEENNDEPDRPVRFTQVPLSQVYMERDAFGGVGAVFQVAKYKISDIKVKWPKAKFTNADLLKLEAEEPEKEIDILVATYRDWSVKTEEVNRYCVIAKQYEDEVYQEELRGEGSNPWVVGGWSRSAGETYARGPLLNALPAIRTLNLVVQMILENADLAISGMWQGDDDGVLNPDTVRLVPGTIVPKAPNSTGLTPLETPGRFDVGQMILEDMRHNVRKALYNETLGPREGTPPSATEVSERMADLARQIGSPFGRIWAEVVEPTVRRVLYIRRKQGAIKIPRIGGQYVKIRPTAALAKAQRYEDINNERYFYTTIAELYGPEMVALVSRPEDVTARFADLYQVSKAPLRTKVEVKDLIEKVKQAMAQAQQAKQAGPSAT